MFSFRSEKNPAYILLKHDSASGNSQFSDRLRNGVFLQDFSDFIPVDRFTDCVLVHDL